MSEYRKDPSAQKQILRYARFLVRRSLVSSTLGNLAVRVADPAYPDTGVAYTKCRGVSLEEMTAADVVVTEIPTHRLLCGQTPPSDGHRMARTIFAARREVNAVIHTHPDSVIGYFSQLDDGPFRFVSIDTAVVLGAAVAVLPRGLNIESDTRPIELLIANTNCIVMPNHGLTTVGRNLSEAYHRHTVFISEVNRILVAMLVASAENQPVSFVADEETKQHFKIGERLIYGTVPPTE